MKGIILAGGTCPELRASRVTSIQSYEHPELRASRVTSIQSYEHPELRASRVTSIQSCTSGGRTHVWRFFRHTWIHGARMEAMELATLENVKGYRLRVAPLKGAMTYGMRAIRRYGLPRHHSGHRAPPKQGRISASGGRTHVYPPDIRGLTSVTGL